MIATSKFRIEIPDKLIQDRINSCPTQNITPRTRFKASRTKNKLPSDYHKTLIELENTFWAYREFETMQEILFFYKVSKFKFS